MQIIAFGPNRWLVMRRKASKHLVAWGSSWNSPSAPITVWVFPGFERLAFLLGWPQFEIFGTHWLVLCCATGRWLFLIAMRWNLGLDSGTGSCTRCFRGARKGATQEAQNASWSCYSPNFIDLWVVSMVPKEGGHILHNSSRIPQQLEHAWVWIANDWIVSSSLMT